MKKAPHCMGGRMSSEGMRFENGKSRKMSYEMAATFLFAILFPISLGIVFGTPFVMILSPIFGLMIFGLAYKLLVLRKPHAAVIGDNGLQIIFKRRTTILPYWEINSWSEYANGEIGLWFDGSRYPYTFDHASGIELVRIIKEKKGGQFPERALR
jgi:hypothetical protein